MAKDWKIYGLVDPRDDRVRYVGCTTAPSLSYRLSNHVDQARHIARRGYKAARSVWIREVEAEGLRPTITHLQTAFSAEEGARVESEWIERFGDQLTNQVGGGPGAPNPSPEVRQKLSEAQQRIWSEASDEKRAAVGERGRKSILKAQKAAQEVWRGRKHTPEARRKMAEAQRGSKHSESTKAKMRESQRRRRERERQHRTDE